MNNWWIAALEHAGVWTREQAEHVSDNMKNAIHRERYAEAYQELEGILQEGKFKGLSTIDKLKADVEELRNELENK